MSTHDEHARWARTMSTHDEHVRWACTTTWPHRARKARTFYSNQMIVKPDGLSRESRSFQYNQILPDDADTATAAVIYNRITIEWHIAQSSQNCHLSHKLCLFYYSQILPDDADTATAVVINVFLPNETSPSSARLTCHRRPDRIFSPRTSPWRRDVGRRRQRRRRGPSHGRRRSHHRRHLQAASGTSSISIRRIMTTG